MRAWATPWGVAPMGWQGLAVLGRGNPDRLFPVIPPPKGSACPAW